MSIMPDRTLFECPYQGHIANCSFAMKTGTVPALASTNPFAIPIDSVLRSGVKKEAMQLTLLRHFSGSGEEILHLIAVSIS